MALKSIWSFIARNCVNKMGTENDSYHMQCVLSKDGNKKAEKRNNLICKSHLKKFREEKQNKTKTFPIAAVSDMSFFNWSIQQKNCFKKSN